MQSKDEKKVPDTKAQKAAKPKKKKRLRTWQWILICLLLVLLALVVAAVITVFSTLNKINRVDPNETYLTPEQAETLFQGDDQDTDNYGSDGSDVIWPGQTEELIGESDNVTNILLIGQDRRPGEVRARSDSMILLSFNKERNQITMVSFLRDNYVQIPGGYRDNRLNAAYAFGGMGLLDETLAVNFGVHVDANIEVDFEGFEGVIDLLGGVDIELTEAEAKYLSTSKKTYTTGLNHLNGAAALSYARIRALDSDFGRTNRQRKVLDSLIVAFRDVSLGDALELANQVLPMLTTDMSNSDVIGYVTDLLPLLSSAKKVNSISIPGDADYYNATIRGMMVLVPDLEECREILRNTLS